jgi:hypothetical protein
MHEANGADAAPLNDFAIAAKATAELLDRLGGSAAQLTRQQLAAYPKRGFAAGWRVNVGIAGKPHSLDLLLTPGFPWQPPRVALVGAPPFLTWPHVEEDALLCLAPNTLETDADNPAGVVAVTLQSACDLVAHLEQDEFDAEFRDEFLTYWSWAAHEKCPVLFSLVNPAPPTRTVYLWRGTGSYVLGESAEQIEHWLTNRKGSKIPDFEAHPSPFLWLGVPLVPREFPNTGQDLLALAARAVGSDRGTLADILTDTPDRIVVALGFATPSGPALAGVVAAAPTRTAHGAREPLSRGFRPGKVPDGVLLARYFGEGKLLRGSVTRADAAWIHGRGHDPRFEHVGQASVAIIGCGSVGSPIAIALAQAGVGRLVLVDFDILTWANAGRHPLGASAVGQNKAKALAEKLRGEFPNSTIENFDADVDTMVRRHAATLVSCDLIASATGSWSGDGRLEVWRNEGQRMPIVYAWTEAHACAGHAVLVGQAGGCLRCGFGTTGVPKFQITEWSSGALRAEPACGALYQPYGPIELGFINSVAAELALDAILNEEQAPAHRVWVGASRRLRALGGNWTSVWTQDPQFRDEGDFCLTRPWPTSECSRCKKT